MKLIAISAFAAIAVAKEAMLKASNGGSDECADCEVAPPASWECKREDGYCSASECGIMRTRVGEAADEFGAVKVECDMEEGYYADASNSRGFCFCSGSDNVDGYGNRVPSKWQQCPPDTVYDAGCQSGGAENNHMAALSKDVGYAGGCCVHVSQVLESWECNRDDGYCSASECGIMRTRVGEGADEFGAVKVECDMEEGYYADASDCRGFCFCSGSENKDGSARVPSKWHQCPPATVYDAGCKSGGATNNHMALLANEVGYVGGCCSHVASVLNFEGCAGACERLSKYHCGKSTTCAWDGECDCCRPN